MPKLTGFRVQGLLNRFDHSISFPEEWELAVLHGPNGIGKTKMLELIESALSPNIGQLEQIPFAHARLSFDDKSVLEVEKIPNRQEYQGPDGSRWTVANQLLMKLYPQGSRQSIDWDSAEHTRDPATVRHILNLIERNMPISRIDTGWWVDHRTNERMTTDTLLARHAHLFTDFGSPNDGIPAEYQQFFHQNNVHLIETQRLLNLAEPRPDRGRRPEAGTRSRVGQYANDLTGRLADVLARNSRASQDLDKTFPRRVLLERFAPPEATEALIRQRYAEQSDLRTQLEDIAVLDTSEDFPLPDKRLEDWERHVLWTYLDDVDKKLSTFRDLLDRINLLRDIVNSRFLFKKLTISRETGFAFETPEGQSIEPEKLSSGEQHELVLLYDLLFNVAPSSLVLIDEPEISLHVTWQQEFLNDITRIANLTSLRFIVATHSPQILHKWWNREIALAPNAGDE